MAEERRKPKQESKGTMTVQEAGRKGGRKTAPDTRAGIL